MQFRYKPGNHILTVSVLLLLSVTQLSNVPCHATTKGLNQIVTPDTQPEGLLTLGAQQQDPNIGNRDEFQLELGLTKNFELAVFQGSSPAEQIANAELGLYAKGPYLLSTGFLNWSTQGSAPQPFLEAGYYKGSAEFVAGAIQVATVETGTNGVNSNVHQTQGLFGAAYKTGSHMQVQMDYQAGSSNFITAGITYSLTSTVSINPALYVTNSTPRHSFGFVVLTWQLQAFGASAPATPQQASKATASSPKQPATGKRS